MVVCRMRIEMMEEESEEMSIDAKEQSLRESAERALHLCNTAAPHIAKRAIMVLLRLLAEDYLAAHPADDLEPKWYSLSEITNWPEAKERGIVGADITIDESGEVHDENAEWLHKHLNLAFHKGQHFAEHPADDEEPVTEQWLKSIGFVTGRHTGSHWLQHTWRDTGGDKHFLQVNLPDHAYLNDEIGVVLKTRGDVSRLCQVLGVELKESENAESI